MCATLTLKPGTRLYFVGIKGTGMCALAELLHKAGIQVSGSDREEVFYTDAILQDLGIPYAASFAAERLAGPFDGVIYSAAYDPETHPELIEARKRGIPLWKYPDALGAYSAGFNSSGITGVHGKTTTTAMAGVLARAVGLPAQILAGSGVRGFGGHSTLRLGNVYFIAETCEYRRHFLAFHPRRIVLTSVESDHQDYYPTYESIRDAFLEYIGKLPPGGELIYCADDPGARETAERAYQARGKGELTLSPYGFSAEGKFRLEEYRLDRESQVLRLRGLPQTRFRLRIPGRHSALNCAAALALTDSLLRLEFGEAGWTAERLEGARKALEDFQGSKRRSEALGEAGGILFMDDYGHHPTAIRTTLAGLREFYPTRRIVLSFMSHTYTRTAALLEDFAASFGDADTVILHRIYGSAREEYRGGITGETLFQKTKALRGQVYYQEEPEEAAALLESLLRPGDLFITMGAGDNWKLGRLLLERYGGSGA
ncbi:MAG: UDP-N-acetylmuramate--L-alanine ligase [Treponema sp.]|jgi:UDP-N-acetylmuramate--alanine ligase|nr:UDP-N-acetylmuramate--L-alanine ligase [Treponema sp.]